MAGSVASSQKLTRFPCSQNCRRHRRWERTTETGPKATGRKEEWGGRRSYGLVTKTPCAFTLPAALLADSNVSGRATGPESGPSRSQRNPNRKKEARSPSNHSHPVKRDTSHLPPLNTLCRRFEAANAVVLKKILETEETAMGKASRQLQQYNKAGSNVLAVQSWGDRQLRDALQDLEETRERGEQRLQALKGELVACNAKLRDAQTRLQELQDYRDSGHLVAARQIADLRRELQLLLDTHQAQAADVDVLTRAEMQNLLEKHRKLLESKLQSIVQHQMDLLPPSIRRMSLENHQMKQDIAIHQQVICELQEEVSCLQETRKTLLKSKQQKVEKLCRDLLLHAPRCSPEEDVALNIPRNEEILI
ncbi:uncharacterized protein C20orf96 homolog isoform X2 [Spea bombifrons]|nr:uncharacterized protein C20orf96 homolog isoform X2 [Spea bombifrons]